MSEGTIPGREAIPGKGLGGTHLESKESEGTECEGKGEERHGLTSQKRGTLDKVHLSLLMLWKIAQVINKKDCNPGRETFTRNIKTATPDGMREEQEDGFLQIPFCDEG